MVQGKRKLIGIFLIGCFLFMSSLMVFLDYFEDDLESESYPHFIKVNEGRFTYLDSKGYNLAFYCQINGIILQERKTAIGFNQIEVFSENAFGETIFVFDKLNEKQVKFTIDHQGNLERYYDFQIVFENNGLKIHNSKPIIGWGTGFLNFDDMLKEERFSLGQTVDKKVYLGVKYEKTADFFIDPLLSQDLFLGSFLVDTYDDSRFNGFSDRESFFWDTSNSTGWTQLYSDNASVLGSYNADLLQNRDFDSSIASSIYDSSINDDYGSWYATNGNPSVIDPNSISNETTNWAQNESLHLNFEKNGTDFDPILNVGYEDGIPQYNWSFETYLNGTYQGVQSTRKRSGTYGGELTVYNSSESLYLFGWVEQNISMLADDISSVGLYMRAGALIPTSPIQAQRFITVFYSDGSNDTTNFNGIPASYTWTAVSSFDTGKTVTKVRAGANDENHYQGGERDYKLGTWIASDDWQLVYFLNDLDISSYNHPVSWINSPEWSSTSFNELANYSVRFIEGNPIEYVNVSDHNSLSFGDGSSDSPFSVSAWVYVDEADADVYFINKKGASGNEWMLMGEYSPPSYLYPILRLYSNDTASVYIQTKSDVILTYDTWHYIAARYDGSGNQSGLDLIIDAVNVSQTKSFAGAGSYIAMNNTAQEVQIGGTQATIKHDEIIIYNESISNDFILWNYQKAPRGFSNLSYFDESLKVRYEFNEATAYTTLDLSSNEYDGNISVTDAWDSTSYNAEADYCLNDTGTSYVLISEYGNETDLAFSDGSTDKAFAVELWFNSDLTGTVEHWLAGKFDEDYDGGPIEWEITTRTTDSLFFNIYADGETTRDVNQIGRLTGTITTKAWYHLFAYYDGSGDSSGIRIYLNGSRADASNWATGSYSAGQNRTAYNNTWNAPFSLMNYVGGTRNYQLSIDSFRFWSNDTLSFSDEEILWRFQNSPNYLGVNNLNGGSFGNNSYSLELSPNESVAQDIYLDTDNINNIILETKNAGFVGENEGLEITMYYSDQTNTTQTIQHDTSNLWFTDVSADEFTNISAGKNAIKIEFTSLNSLYNLYLDNIEVNYSVDMTFHNESEFTWKPIGLSEWDYNNNITERSNFFFHKLIADGDRKSGMFINNSFLGLDTNDSWIVSMNLTFNPFAEFYTDNSFAGAIRFHFLDSSNDSLSYVDLLDNSTSLSTHQIGGSLFYNTSASGGEFAEDYDFDSTNYNLTLELLEIKKAGNGIFARFPNSTDFGGNWSFMEDVSTVFQEGNPSGMAIEFIRLNGSRSIDFPNRNTTIRDYFSNGADYSENFTSSTAPNNSRYVLDAPMSINSLNFTSWEITVNETISNVTGQWYGFLVNGSNQVFYKMNYTISEPNNTLEWLYHNHSFFVPYNYTFYNATFGNGVNKTIISGFQFSSYNSSHNQIFYEDIVEGNFTWFFLTGNAITNLIINPQWQINGTLTNTSLIYYNVRVANGSNAIQGYPLNISLKTSDEVILLSVEASTDANGWFNNSFDAQVEMLSDHQFWVCATGLNSSFLGYAADYYLSYNDWYAPVIESMTYEEVLNAGDAWNLEVSITEDWTNDSDLSVTMYYSYISSTSEDLDSSLSYSAGVWSLSLNGRDADTTIWFRIEAIDNVSNTVSSPTLSSTWEIPAEEEAPPIAGGDGGNGRPAAVTVSKGADNTMLILVFAAGAIMVAVIGYAVMRRVTVRTRRVETREVITGFGRFGRSEEKIEEKGG